MYTSPARNPALALLRRLDFKSRVCEPGCRPKDLAIGHIEAWWMKTARKERCCHGAVHSEAHDALRLRVHQEAQSRSVQWRYACLFTCRLCSWNFAQEALSLLWAPVVWGLRIRFIPLESVLQYKVVKPTCSAFAGTPFSTGCSSLSPVKTGSPRSKSFHAVLLNLWNTPRRSWQGKTFQSRLRERFMQALVCQCW